MRAMLRDLKYALRNLQRTPAFTIVVVLTLALGIGANTAIFSVVDALLFKPLPYADADRLYAVTFANNAPLGSQYWPYPKYAAFAAEQTAFESTAAYARGTLTITARDQAMRVESEVVTATYFPLLRVGPAFGRVFFAQENQVPERDAVVILSDSLWRSAFGGDPKVIGSTLTIRNRPYEIVGVMPASFRGQTGSTELWVPAMMAEHFMYKGAATESFGWWMRVVARLKPDVGAELAAAQMPALSDRVNQLAPAMIKTAMKDGRMLIDLLPLRTVKVDPAITRSFGILLAAVGFVLLIACANTANLLLGRAVSRQNEFAVRRALGASTRNIMRQVLVESLVLASAAGVAALVVSMWTLEWLSAVKPMNATGFWSQYSRTFDYFAVSLDPRMLVFNFAVALGVGLVFGLLPGLQASRSDLNDALKQRSGPSRSSFGGVTVRGALVVAEVSLSLVLLVCAGLTIRSFARATTADLGFQPAQLVMMTAATERKPVSFYQELLSRVSGIAGVQSAALIGGAPLSSATSRGPIEIEGRPQTDRVQADFNVVTPGVFTTLGMRRVAGRLFTDDDRDNAPRVAVVNRTFAAAAWPGEDAIGKHVRHGFRLPGGDPLQWTTVIGVVDDVANGPLEEPSGCR
jgi:putative ABC transport system permease protein